MTVDVREGDVLVVNSIDYPIKSVGDWAAGLGLTPAFRRLARLDAVTKRSPAVSAGKRGEPALYLANLKCTPLDPVNAEVRQRLALETPHELLATFLADADGYVQLVLENLKT